MFIEMVPIYTIIINFTRPQSCAWFSSTLSLWRCYWRCRVTTLCETLHLKIRSSRALSYSRTYSWLYPTLRESLKRQNSIRDPAMAPCFQGPPVPSVAWIKEVHSQYCPIETIHCIRAACNFESWRNPELLIWRILKLCLDLEELWEAVPRNSKNYSFKNHMPMCYNHGLTNKSVKI